jgi:hypothetical protein
MRQKLKGDVFHALVNFREQNIFHAHHTLAVGGGYVLEIPRER